MRVASSARRTSRPARSPSAAAALAAALAVAACGGGDGPTDPGGPDPTGDVAAVEVATSSGSGADTLDALGSTVQLEATARDADGDPVSGVEVTWSTSDEAVATVDDGGTVTAVGNGEAEVTASAGDASGDVAVAVAQAVAGVTVTPSSTVLTSVGATQQFSVTAVDDNDNPVQDVALLWQTSDPDVAVVDTGGVAEARSPGTATITAAAQGVPGHASLTVAPEGTRLVFDGPPSDGAVDETLAPVRVAVEDGAGNRVPVDGLEVTLSLAADPGGATLSGTTTATTSGGVAEFTSLTLDAWGDDFTLTVQADGLDGATSAPFDVELLFTQMDAGDTHTCGVTPAGAIFCWGVKFGLGIDPDANLLSPVPTPQRTHDPPSGPVTWEQVAAGLNVTCALTTEGVAYCWGTNIQGGLGTGTTEDGLVPTRVADPASGAVTWSRLSSLGFHTCGITSDGRAFCWGPNGAGQLGDGTTTDRDVPTPVSDPASGPVTWTEIDVGSQFTCGKDASDRVFCWGDNEAGQLGDGTTTDVSVPTQANSFFALASASELTVGGHHVCAMSPDRDRLDCWGEGASGQHENGGATSFVFDALSAGGAHNCGLTIAAEAVCWGAGPLGDGTYTGGENPVLVAEPASGPVLWEQITAGRSQASCGLTPSGAAYCWGENDLGQVGDGTLSTALVPKRVGG